MASSWIAVGEDPVVVGRGREADVRLTDRTISRTHATLQRHNDAIVIEDHESRYGTFVNGNRIRRAILHVGDNVRFGTVLTFRVEADGLRYEPDAVGMAISVENLVVARDGNCIVQDVSFRIPAKKLVGILGPSGGGKSTILNCLATYLRPGQGRVIFDEAHDIEEFQDEFRAAMGHVPQEDSVFPALTVRENLHFAARLRLDNPDCDGSSLDAEVDRVLRLMDLSGHSEKTAAVLSGGQKKRLSVGVELLRRPRLLLLDEPTSGLDPGTGTGLMENLRHISRQGTTVVLTTHALDNVQLFDLLIVLGVKNDVGQIAYCGPADGLLPHFSCDTLPDVYDKLAHGEFVPYFDHTGNDGSSVGQDTVSDASDKYNQPWHDNAFGSPSAIAPSRRLRLTELVKHTPLEHAVGQWITLCHRTVTMVLRERAFVAALTAQPLFLGTLVCLTQYKAARIVSTLFFLIVIAIWLGLNNSARELVRDRKLYIRDRLAGLRPDAYVLSKFAVLALAGAIQILLLLLLVSILAPHTLQENAAEELRESSSLWLFLVLMICYLAALGLGLLLSAIVPNEETAVAWLPLLIMPQLLLSAVGTFQMEEVYRRQCYKDEVGCAFRPLAFKFQGDRPLDSTALIADSFSLLLYSRPALLVAKQPKLPKEYGQQFYMADLCHLGLLLLVTWLAAGVLFSRSEQRWIALIGVG